MIHHDAAEQIDVGYLQAKMICQGGSGFGVTFDHERAHCSRTRRPNCFNYSFIVSAVSEGWIHVKVHIDSPLEQPGALSFPIGLAVARTQHHRKADKQRYGFDAERQQLSSDSFHHTVLSNVLSRNTNRNFRFSLQQPRTIHPF